MREHTESALGRLALVSLFALAPRLFFVVDLAYPAEVIAAPHTYLAITHKRDMDAMAPVPPLLWRRGWRSLTREVHFATRADAFAPGFLARIVPHPRWLAHLLRPISVGPVLRGVGVHPLHGLHLRPMETWVREWLAIEGDAPTSTVLAQDTIARLAEETTHKLAEHLAAQPLARLLKWRYHSALQRMCGPEIFTDVARRSAVRHALVQIERQIAELAHCLQSGHSIYTSPEGRLSPDGRLSPIPGGLTRLLEVAPPDTRVLPIAVVYDFIQTGRTRMFVDVAPPIEGGAQLAPKELAERLRVAWLGAMRFTCTQLATGIIVGRTAEPSMGWTIDEVAQAVGTWAHDLASSGRHVDARLLDQRQARERVVDYVRYLARRKLVRRDAGGRWQLATEIHPIQVAPGEVGYNREPLTYAWNELQEMLAAPATVRPDRVRVAFREPGESQH